MTLVIILKRKYKGRKRQKSLLMGEPTAIQQSMEISPV